MKNLFKSKNLNAYFLVVKNRVLQLVMLSPEALNGLRAFQPGAVAVNVKWFDGAEEFTFSNALGFEKVKAGETPEWVKKAIKTELRKGKAK